MRLPAASACSSSWRQFSEAVHDGVTSAITASETSIARASSSRQRDAAGMSARLTQTSFPAAARRSTRRAAASESRRE